MALTFPALLALGAAFLTRPYTEATPSAAGAPVGQMSLREESHEHQDCRARILLVTAILLLFARRSARDGHPTS